MEANEILTQVTRFLLGLVALAAAIDFLRHRDRTRLDIALMLASLGLPVLVPALPDAVSQLRWVATLSAMAIVAQPYLLLRLVEDFHAVPRPVLVAGIGGMAISWGVLILYGSSVPVAVVLSIVGYFLLIEGYAAIAFSFGARASGGVSRWRYGLAASGSALLAASILLAGMAAAISNVTSTVGAFRSILPVFAAISYYLGFAPPGWLRQTWQLPEVRKFLRVVAGQPARERASRMFDEACATATRATGGLASVLFFWDSEQQRFVAAATDVPALQSFTFTPDDGPLTKTWQEGHSAAVKSLAGTGVASARLVMLVRASALLTVPVATPHRVWGILVVLQRRGSLFPSDDLALLEILSEQCAIARENAELVAEQQRRVAEEQRLVALLETSNKEMEAFTYSVSHDLRAPLRAIDGFSNLLLEGYATELPAEAQRYLGVVSKNARQMGMLIDDLLRLSRVTRQELDKRPLNPLFLVKETINELRDQQNGRCVEFIIGDLLDCEADAALLKQVFVNLLANAFKYTQRRPQAKIEVGSYQDQTSDENVYFIRDNGVGFDMRYVNKLFGVFQRLHRPEEYEGTGVGLATVQRIVQRHGGRVWAEGEVDQGATFYFTL